MNGSKSTFKRKGYWLTAFATAVLLAASPGTASAQIVPDTEYDTDGFKVDGLGKTIAEGDATVIQVSLRAMVEASVSATTVAVTVTIAAADPEMPTDDTTDNADDGDVTLTGDTGSGVEVNLIFPAGGTEDATYTRTANVYLGTGQDGDAEDEDFAVRFVVTNAPGVDQENIQVTIDDDETQTYDLTLETDKPAEGTDIEVNLKAVPAHDDGSAMLTLHLDDPEYRHDQTGVVVVNSDDAAAGDTIMITPPGDDGNRVEDSVTLTAYSGAVGRATEQASLTIKVADINELPAVAMMVVDEDGAALEPQPTSVTEGDSVMVAVMPVDEDGDVMEDGFAEELTVQLMPTGTADAADYTLTRTITIEMNEDASKPVELEVRSDEDVGTDMLMFDAVVSGDSEVGTETRTSAAVLSLSLEDDTAKKITPKASAADYEALMAAIAAGGGDDGVNPGDTVTLMTSDLFDVEPGYTASYGVSVEGDSASASASGETVTINAMMAGEAKITVTGTARMASSSLIPTQTVSNVAELTFPVMVVDTELVVTLSADPMEVEAGGTTMITATANRAVTAGDGAVTVHLTVVGDGMLDAESITIAMGDMSGSATLTANESVTVVATGSGVTGLMQVAVTATDAPEPVPEPVPALPLIGQLLLGLGLLGGGARHLYRRRQG